jgi:hypothetical protein
MVTTNRGRSGRWFFQSINNLYFIIIYTLESLKIIYIGVKEHTHMQMEENTLENLKMAKKTDKEHTHLQMEENT